MSNNNIPNDAIVVSTVTKTVQETLTKEWRTITFNASPIDGSVSITAVYEEVVRVNGVPTSREIIRERVIPWADALQIAPALIQVREQLTAAMPVILTNTP